VSAFSVRRNGYDLRLLAGDLKLRAVTALASEVAHLECSPTLVVMFGRGGDEPQEGERRAMRVGPADC
jgi:hypothetical protein